MTDAAHAEAQRWYGATMAEECWLLRDERMLEHKTMSGHPECPDRLRAIWDAMAGLAGVRWLGAEPATREQVLRIHTPGHFDLVARTAGQFGQLDADTSVSPKSFEAAMLAAGAAVSTTAAVVRREAASAFLFVRPPGHHAEADQAMGFCLFNNIAIAAAHARAELGCERVLIVDWDVHHGNGTQRAFYDRRDVLFFSTHQYPLYPGSGWVDEVGQGDAAGYTVNVPMPPGSGDPEYQAAFREVLVPVADAYKPDLVLVSAGFDAHRDDPLAGMSVSDDGYARMAETVRQIAERHAQGRLVLLLEGGYDLDALGRSTRRCVEVLTGRPSRAIGDASGEPSAMVQTLLNRLRDRLREHWPL